MQSHLKLLLATAMIAFAGSAIASDDPNNPVSISLPFDTLINVELANPAGAGSPWEDCEDSHHSVFYTFNSGSVTTIDFFAIGEDTEITVSPLADPGSDCLGGDEDAEPDFADVGLSEPTGWDSSQNISNSEWFQSQSITANTDYIVKVAFNDESSNDSYDIAWGIAETPVASTPVPALPLFGLLALGGLLGLFGLRKLKK